MMRGSLLALLFLPVALCAELSWHDTRPGGFAAFVFIPENEVVIPSTFSVELTLGFPQGYHIDQEALKAHLLRHSPLSEAPFAMHSAESKTSQLPDGSMVQKIQYILVPQIEGNFKLSFYDIVFFSDDPSGKQVEIISDIFDIKATLTEWMEKPENILIGPLLPLSPHFPINMSAENRYRLIGPASNKIAAQHNVDVFAQKEFPWWNLLFVIALLLLVWMLKESRKAPQTIPETENQRASRIKNEALQKIESLSVLPSQAQFMPYYVELTNAVRSYIENRYHLHAPKRTTQEFLHDAANYPQFDEEMRERLKRFLVSADRVKFARHQPTLEECSQALQDAEDVIGT